MRTPMEIPSPSPSAGFVGYCAWLGLSDAQTIRLHSALHAYGSRETHSVLHALERFGQRRSRAAVLQQLTRFGMGVENPHNIIGLLEKLVEGRLLSRSEGSAVEELLLSKTGAHGQYR